MSASVVSFSKVRERLGFRRWSNQDVAEIYRVADTLHRAGLPVDCEEGQSDEGDPWYAFCNVNTGDVIVHFAFIDGKYVAEVSQLGVSFKGNTLSEIVNQFLNTYPVVLPSQKSSVTRVWMHPASGFVAFIATLYFLLEMTHSAEARESSSGMTIDGEAQELDASDDLEFTGDLAAYHRAQVLRSMRNDGAASSDGVRSVAVSAAILIAGVLMDWHRTSDAAVAFEPESILDAILTKSGDELGDAIILALRNMAGFDLADDAGSSTAAEGDSVRTAHVVQADGAIDEIGASDDGIAVVDEDEHLIIDVDGEFGDAGRAIGAELVGDADVGTGEAAARKAGGSGVLVEGRLADTIAASFENTDAAVDGGNNQDAASGGDALGSSDSPSFFDTASQSSTFALLESLGLKSGTSGLGSDSDVITLVQLISGGSGTASSSDASTQVPIPESDTDYNVEPVGTGGSLPPSTGYGTPGPDHSYGVTEMSPPSQASDTGPHPYEEVADYGNSGPGSSNSGSSSPDNSGPGSSGSTISGSTISGSGNSGYSDGQELYEFRDHDFSIFDPIEVVRLFVQTVEKVGFAHLDEIFYLYDAVAIATAPETLEFEQLHLANGDEVNLLGQAETFDTIYDALV